MTEPSERDREMVDEWSRRSPDWLPQLVAAAREEGRREERARCAALVRAQLSPAGLDDIELSPQATLETLLMVIERGDTADAPARAEHCPKQQITEEDQQHGRNTNAISSALRRQRS